MHHCQCSIDTDLGTWCHNHKYSQTETQTATKRGDCRRSTKDGIITFAHKCEDIVLFRFNSTQTAEVQQPSPRTRQYLNSRDAHTTCSSTIRTHGAAGTHICYFPKWRTTHQKSLLNYKLTNHPIWKKYINIKKKHYPIRLFFWMNYTYNFFWMNYTYNAQCKTLVFYVLCCIFFRIQFIIHQYFIIIPYWIFFANF